MWFDTLSETKKKKIQFLNAMNSISVFEALRRLPMDVFYMCTFYEEGSLTLQSARKQFRDKMDMKFTRLS